jgi:hypothetical protein
MPPAAPGCRGDRGRPLPLGELIQPRYRRERPCLLPAGTATALAEVQCGPSRSCQQQDQACGEDHGHHAMEGVVQRRSRHRAAAAPGGPPGPAGSGRQDGGGQSRETPASQGRSGPEMPWPERCLWRWLRSWIVPLGWPALTSNVHPRGPRNDQAAFGPSRAAGRLPVQPGLTSPHQP